MFGVFAYCKCSLSYFVRRYLSSYKISLEKTRTKFINKTEIKGRKGGWTNGPDNVTKVIRKRYEHREI